MTVGKNPHRPEGKANADNPHMQAAWMNEGPPHNASRNEKAAAERDRENMARTSGGPTSFPAEEQIGGSRPGVPSRVKDAIAEREAREAEDEEG